jgi:hypothetical protein
MDHHHFGYNTKLTEKKALHPTEITNYSPFFNCLILMLNWPFSMGANSIDIIATPCRFVCL